MGRTIGSLSARRYWSSQRVEEGLVYEAGGTQTMVSRTLRVLCVLCKIYILLSELPRMEFFN